jgi:putative membrane protein
MRSRSTGTGRLTLAIALVTAGTLLAGCKRAANTLSDTSAAAGEVARKDSMSDTTRASSNPANAAVPNTDGWSDAQILAYAAAANNAEIAQGRLAERKATNPAVKAFAREMVTDHQAMMREGKSFASSNKITPDTTQRDITELTKDSRSLIKDLTAKPAGNDWDAAYMSKQVDEHKAVLDKLQNFEKSTTSTKLKDLLNTAVGKVQSHLTKAQDVKDNKIKA